LEAIAVDFPEVIAAVRGRGLMLGVEVRREGVGGALMSELLHRHVLALWTLNNERVIRMIPPVTIPVEVIHDVLSEVRSAAKTVAEIAEEL
ncbi:putrescine--2-oxoglutarate aminotransferase, partial [mine drainage metagenome]